jgi:dGTPase
MKSEIFSYSKVIAIESSGRHVINGLLDLYIGAFKDIDKKYAKNLISLMPENLRVEKGDKEYDALIKICI